MFVSEKRYLGAIAENFKSKLVQNIYKTLLNENAKINAGAIHISPIEKVGPIIYLRNLNKRFSRIPPTFDRNPQTRARDSLIIQLVYQTIILGRSEMQPLRLRHIGFPKKEEIQPKICLIT